MTTNPRAGLCPSCLHARIVTSKRGSRFLLCARAKDDPAYPKSPPQPLPTCPGFDQRPPSGADS